MKARFPRSAAVEVARELCVALQPVCVRLVVAGSLRRRKAEVGDVELVYIGKMAEERTDLFAMGWVDLAERAIDALLREGVLERRPNKLGNFTWGPSNKLALHRRSGIPVDLFATREPAWWNYVMCRTGGAETNRRIAAAALAKGWAWHPYSRGFTDEHGTVQAVHSEEDVFRMAGIPYLKPEERP